MDSFKLVRSQKGILFSVFQSKNGSKKKNYRAEKKRQKHDKMRRKHTTQEEKRKKLENKRGKKSKTKHNP